MHGVWDVGDPRGLLSTLAGHSQISAGNSFSFFTFPEKLTFPIPSSVFHLCVPSLFLVLPYRTFSFRLVNENCVRCFLDESVHAALVPSEFQWDPRGMSLAFCL